MSSGKQTGGWIAKFKNAFRGIGLGITGQSSFYVHGIAAVAVLGLAAWLQVSLLEWAILLICITMVLAAEMFNSALEWMAQAVDQQHNPQLGGALDIASAAVLVTAIGAAAVGGILLGTRFWSMLQT